MNIEKPIIYNYIDSRDFLTDQIRFLKKSEDSFTISEGVKNLRKISKSLVSLVLQKKRKITLDRIDGFSKLLHLSPREKQYFKYLVESENGILTSEQLVENSENKKSRKLSRQDSNDILKDWLNIYVKDAFRIKRVQLSKKLLYRVLGGIASEKRIEKSLKTLLKDGHLKRTLQDRIVVDTPLAIADTEGKNLRIRNFHKASLKVARESLAINPVSERFANAMVLAISEKGYMDLIELVGDFSNKLMEFSKNSDHDANRLYQIIVHLNPVGAKVDFDEPK